MAKRISQTDWAYFAGILDGEGSIRVSTAGHLYLDVSNTDGRLMDWLQSHFGGRRIYEAKPNPRHKPLFRFRIGGKVVGTLLQHSIRHLIIKKEQAILMLRVLAWRERCRTTGESLWHPPQNITDALKRIRDLNVRGIHHR